MFTGNPLSRDNGGSNAVNAKVFVSHSHADEAAYSTLCVALDGAGVQRWDVSELLPGSPLSRDLRRAIGECDVCVFLATVRSLESPWCLAELGAFWGAGKPVFVYLVDPELTESDIPPQFRNNLWTRDATQLIRAIKETDVAGVHREPDGYRMTCGGMTARVILGRIEECVSESRRQFVRFAGE